MEKSDQIPKYLKRAFMCPHCNKFENQDWYDCCSALHEFSRKTRDTVWTAQESHREPKCNHESVHFPFRNIMFARCHSCAEASVWYGSTIIYPDVILIEPPNSDLNEEIQVDYMEAASIIKKSPRGSAALLRLCIQKLCIQLGKSGDNLSKAIAALVKEGLPVKVQQALDIVRVIGNNAVHPGQIDLRDDSETVKKLFVLVNLIADNRITQQNQIEQLYEGILPESERKKIEKRDGYSSSHMN